jgi:hypothetical protein
VRVPLGCVGVSTKGYMGSTRQRGTRSVENRKLIVDGASHYKAEWQNPKPLVGSGTVRQARGFSRVSVGYQRVLEGSVL